VAVRTEHPQVFQAVIVPDAVDVIEMHVEHLATPFGETARLAAVPKESGSNEARFDVLSVSFRI